MKRFSLALAFLWIFVFLLAFLVFRRWFSLEIISSGDLGFFFPVNIKEYFQVPLSWEAFRQSGLGGYSLPFINTYFYNLPLGFLGKIFDFNLLERIIWLWPIILLSFLAAYILTIYCGFLKQSWFPFVWIILFLNTYFLNVVGGGQITVAFGYLFLVICFSLFLKIIANQKIERKKIIIFSLALTLLIAFDLRFAYIFFLVCFIHFLFHFRLMKNYLKIFAPAVLISVLIHSYWLLPMFMTRWASLPEGYEKGGWVKFLSFADFSDSFSLLHPNWPENIFGKTYFFRPEFLILPILAYFSLLFISYSVTGYGLRVKKQILFFSFLGLIGAFLAKGSNPPFGGIYLWLFDNFPGMNLFRDPTKFYVLVALSYSILIPFSVSEIHKRLDAVRNTLHVTRYLSKAFLLLVTCYLLLLIKPAILGELGGTFKAKEIPQEYLALKDFIENQSDFFRTFWIPKKQRFGYYSNNHPAIESESFMSDFWCKEPLCSLKVNMSEEWGQDCPPNDRCCVRELSYFLNPQAVNVLSQLAVKYIVVPSDPGGEIFVAEHRYNPQQRKEVENFLDTIPWLKKVDVVDKIAVYELPEFKDHFFIDLLTSSRVNELKSWKMINPTKYLISLKIEQAPVKLVFSETYDELWQARLPAWRQTRPDGQAKVGSETISSQPHMGILNSFSIDKTGDLEVIIEFAGQKYVYYGLIISILTFFFSGVLLL